MMPHPDCMSPSTAEPCVRSEGAVPAEKASATLGQAAHSEGSHAGRILIGRDDLKSQDYES